MYCPKCGTQAIEGTKFCRSCGQDLEVIFAALSGKLKLSNKKAVSDIADEDSDDPDKLWNSFITNGLLGVAFIVIGIFLTITGIIGGNVWGFWLLIPGAACLGSSIASYFKVKRIERRAMLNSAASQTNQMFGQPQNYQSLPPRQTLFATDYTAPAARNTGELVMPPRSSVTENTTRHLEINPDGETINLPSQK